MKQKLLFLFIACTIGAYGYAQCDKKIILTAYGFESRNKQNEVVMKDTQRLTTIVYDAKIIEVVSETSILNGTIDSVYCNWKTPFKEGQTFIKCMLAYDNGDVWPAKLTITGKDGKLSLLVDIEHPDAFLMRFTLDKFEEKK